MTNQSFYLTLLSNSSMSYFPTNTTANFYTKLPKNIKLEGEWVVGLVEFHFPCTMLNVQEHQNVVYMKRNQKVPNETLPMRVEFKNHIPAANYDNINNFLKAFTENPLLKGNIEMHCDDISKRVTVTPLNKDVLSLSATDTLSLQLGFEPRTNFIKTNRGKYPVNLYLGLPHQIFVYTDIIQPQIVGDVMTSLLRVVPMDPTLYIYGAYKMNTFSPAHYLTVMKREFDIIEIDIRTSIGEKVPFEFGTACVKLHFKRVG